MAIQLLFVACLGLAVGSFLNVLISRLPDPDRSFFHPLRSECPRCRQAIAARDNIPVLSWLLLRGKCRTCQTPISIMYPLVELLGAAMIVGTFVLYGASLLWVTSALFLVLLLAIAATDLETMLIPDVYTVGGILVATAIAAVHQGWTGAWHVLANALLVGGCLYGLGWIVSRCLRRAAMGSGDAFLLALIAAYLTVGGALVALFLGAVLGLVPHLWRRWGTAAQTNTAPTEAADVPETTAATEAADVVTPAPVSPEMPFGPALAGGAVLVFLGVTVAHSTAIVAYITLFNQLVPWLAR